MQKLLKLNDDHYVVVDDSEIKEGDYYFSKISDNIFRRIKDGHWIENYDKKMYQKITNSTQPLETYFYEIGGGTKVFGKIQQLSLQEVKELIGEVDVEKKAEIEYREFPNNPNDRHNWPYNKDVNVYRKRKAYIKGYNQCLKDNKDKKYTEEDMIGFFDWSLGINVVEMLWNNMPKKEIFQKYIQSLQPKTEWKVELMDGKLKLK